VSVTFPTLFKENMAKKKEEIKQEAEEGNY
jgi:hypothetical protein